MLLLCSRKSFCPPSAGPHLSVVQQAQQSIYSRQVSHWCNSVHHKWFDSPLNVAYLDVKPAFDSVSHVVLWKALASTGGLHILVDLVAALHRNTGAPVWVGSCLSQHIQTTTGVFLHLCLSVSPLIGSCGICEQTLAWQLDLCTSKISHMLMTLNCFCQLELQVLRRLTLSSFSKVSAPFGLKISWSETKLQNLGSGPAPARISVDNSTIESMVSLLALCSHPAGITVQN